MPNATPRSPSGAYFVHFLIFSISSRDSTRGIITPVAPASSTRETKWRSSVGTRTIQGRFEPRAFRIIRPMVSMEKELCSKSAIRKSAPAFASSVAIAAPPNSSTNVPTSTSPRFKDAFTYMIPLIFDWDFRHQFLCFANHFCRYGHLFTDCED